MANPQKIHFHIQWSEHDAWDWESFNTVEEATSSALGWLRPDESFTIRQTDETCSICANMALQEKR